MWELSLVVTSPPSLRLPFCFSVYGEVWELSLLVNSAPLRLPLCFYVYGEVWELPLVVNPAPLSSFLSVSLSVSLFEGASSIYIHSKRGLGASRARRTLICRHVQVRTFMCIHQTTDAARLPPSHHCPSARSQVSTSTTNSAPPLPLPPPSKPSLLPTPSRLSAIQQHPPLSFPLSKFLPSRALSTMG